MAKHQSRDSLLSTTCIQPISAATFDVLKKVTSVFVAANPNYVSPIQFINSNLDLSTEIVFKLAFLV